jgi:ABC-type dipeptide/oligopeptide/nickel transport system permease component
MVRYAATKVLWGIVVILGTATVAFIVLRIVPGDPITLLLNGTPVAPAVAHAIKAQFHLNDPLIEQYFLYLGGLFKGNLGISMENGQNVAPQIFSVLPTTLELVGAATLIGVVVGTASGLVASWTRWRWLDRLLSASSVFLASIPAFYAGLLLLTLFSFTLGWFPAAGDNGFKSLVLPAVTLSLTVIAIIAQMVRDGMREVMLEPYIFAARAKGLSESAVRLRHALRNAVGPALTAVGVTLGSLVTGAVVIEQVFARQGVGQLAINAITHRDFPVVQGVVLVVAFAYVVVNILVEVLHAYLDPRIR